MKEIKQFGGCQLIPSQVENGGHHCVLSAFQIQVQNSFNFCSLSY